MVTTYLQLLSAIFETIAIVHKFFLNDNFVNFRDFRQLQTKKFKMYFASKTFGWFFILMLWSAVAAVVYIEKAISDSNSDVVKLTVAYTHDAAGNSLSNVTFETFSTVSKMMVYLTIKIADNKENAGMYRDLLKTVIDVDKLLQGNQVNAFVRGYFEDIKRSMNFTLKFPMPPVSNNFSMTECCLKFFLKGTYKIINLMIDGPFLNVLPSCKGLIDFRGVGKFGGSSKTRFLGHVAVSGGIRH